MNNKEIINKIFAEFDGKKLTKKAIGEITDRYIELNVEATLNSKKPNKKHLVKGLGTLYVKELKPRTGRNPQDKTEKIEIPAKTTIRLKAGKVIKDKLN